MGREQGERSPCAEKRKRTTTGTFPDPDLVRLRIDNEWKQQIKGTLPELPDARKARYMNDYGLSSYNAAVITSSKALAEFFDSTLHFSNEPKAVVNWITGDLLGY